jgi:hypothetical protein
MIDARGETLNPVIESMNIDQIRELVANTERALDVSVEGGAVNFRFVDRDRDDLVVTVFQPLNDQQLCVITGFSIGGREVGAIEGSNAWNGDAEHGTTSAVIIGDDDEAAVCLQSQLMLLGGVTEANVRAWLSNFITRIDEWEEVLADAFEEVPADDILTNDKVPYLDTVGRGLAVIAPTLAAVAEGVTHGLLGWLNSDDGDDEPPPRKQRRSPPEARRAAPRKQRR